MPEPRFGTYEVAEMTGVSLRQLQWWCERGVVRPWQGRDERRRYWSSRDVARVIALQQLRAKGVALERARKILDDLGDGRMPAWIAATASGALDVFADDDPHEVLAVIADWSRPVVLIAPGLRDVGLRIGRVKSA